MPKLELDLLDSKKKLSAWAGFRLMAVMLHPQDKKLRAEFLLWKVVREVHERQKAGWNNSKILEADKLGEEFEKYGGTGRLLKARSQDEILRLSNKSVAKAWLVGDMLCGILKIYKDPRTQNIGKNKVVTLIELISQNPKKSSHQYKARSLYDYWKEFNAVSHLWCALRLQHVKRGGANINALTDSETVPPLIGLSEEIRKFCESFKSHPNFPSLLKKEESWTPPNSLKLPPTEIKTSKVEPWLLKLLKKK